MCTGIAILTVAALCAADLEGAAPCPAETGAASAGYKRAVERALFLMNSTDVEWPRGMGEEAAQPGAKAQTALPTLLQMARSADPPARARALEGLARTGGAEGVDAIIAALADPAPAVRNVARETLAAVGPGLAFERVMQVLCGGTTESVEALAEALPALRGTLESEMLQTLACDDEPPERHIAAAYSLGCMGSTAATVVLARRAWSSDRDVAILSADALCAIADPGAMPVFIKLVNHPVPEVRWAAVQGIAQTGGSKAAVALAYVAAGVSEANLALCDEAASLLGRTGDEGAVPLLIQVMRQNPPVRRSAARSLRRLTGEDFGENPGGWWTWYCGRRGEDAAPGAGDDEAQPLPKSEDPLPYLEPFGYEDGIDAITLFGLR